MDFVYSANCRAWSGVQTPSAGSGGNGKRSHNLSVYSMGEINHAFPLLAGQYSFESIGWICRRWFIGVLEVGGVCPGAAHAQIRRPKICCQLAQAGIRQINGWPVLKQRLVQSGRHIRGCLFGCSRTLDSLAGIRLPETPACNFDHLDVIGLKAFVNGANARQFFSSNRGGRRGSLSCKSGCGTQHKQDSACQIMSVIHPAHVFVASDIESCYAGNAASLPHFLDGFW